jgi:cobalt/nickel transport system permease protein
MPLPPFFKLNGPPVYQPILGLAGKRTRLLFLDRTLKAVAGLMAEFVFSEAYALKAGLLQGLDPRFKLIGLLSLVAGVSFLHSLPAIYGLCVLALFLAALSRVGAAFFLKRVWLVLPLFAGAIALPATLNLFTPGDLVWKIGELERAYRFGPYEIPKEIGFTNQGVAAALFLVGRVGASLSFVLLLTLTTPWAGILKAVRSLGVPQVYVQTLGMALRYLMLLSRIVEEMYTAKKSRTLKAGKIRAEQRWIAAQAGALFARSLQLSSEVHRAMIARGYQGEIKILNPFRVRTRDYLWLGSCLGLTAALVYFSY